MIDKTKKFKIFIISYSITLVITTLIILNPFNHNKNSQINKKEITCLKEIKIVNLLNEISTLHTKIKYYKIISKNNNFKDISINNLIEKGILKKSQINQKNQIISQIDNNITYEIKESKENLNDFYFIVICNEKINDSYFNSLKYFILKHSNFNVLVIDKNIILSKKI